MPPENRRSVWDILSDCHHVSNPLLKVGTFGYLLHLLGVSSKDELWLFGGLQSVSWHFWCMLCCYHDDTNRGVKKKLENTAVINCMVHGQRWKECQLSTYIFSILSDLTWKNSDSVREGVPLILGDLNDPKQNTNIILLGTYLWNNNKKKSVNF